jgi:hypothetical protein
VIDTTGRDPGAVVAEIVERVRAVETS